MKVYSVFSIKICFYPFPPCDLGQSQYKLRISYFNLRVSLYNLRIFSVSFITKCAFFNFRHVIWGSLNTNYEFLIILYEFLTQITNIYSVFVIKMCFFAFLYRIVENNWIVENYQIVENLVFVITLAYISDLFYVAELADK